MASDINCICGKFSKIGSFGLVIFERESTLLHHSNPRQDLRLGDISNNFVQLLQNLRLANVRFGFISDTRGMNTGCSSRSEFEALTELLSKLLHVRRASPDFWLGSHCVTDGSRLEWLNSVDQHKSMSIALIQRAIEWYGVDKKETILVGSTLAGLLSANEAGITSIHYSGMRGDRPSPSSLKTNPQFPFPSETTETRRLNIEIQRIVRSKPRTSVDIREGEKFIGPDPFPVADEA